MYLHLLDRQSAQACALLVMFVRGRDSQLRLIDHCQTCEDHRGPENPMQHIEMQVNIRRQPHYGYLVV